MKSSSIGRIRFQGFEPTKGTSDGTIARSDFWKYFGGTRALFVTTIPQPEKEFWAWRLAGQERKPHYASRLATVPQDVWRGRLS
jgi:hypothetical protein